MSFKIKPFFFHRKEIMNPNPQMILIFFAFDNKTFHSKAFLYCISSYPMLNRFLRCFQYDMCEVKISPVCPLYGQCHLQVKM